MNQFIKLISWPTLWQAAARLITGAASVFLTVILTRSNLGVSGFGDFTKILALVSFFYLPADFGLNATFIQLVSKTGLVKKLFFNLISARLFWSTVLFLASFLIISGFYKIDLKVSLIASATILTTAASTTALAYFQLKLAYFWQFLASLVAAVFALFLIFLNLPILTLEAIFGAILTGQFFGVLVNFSKIFSELKFLAEKIDLTLVKKYFQQSFALGLTLIFNLIYFKADIILLSLLSTSTSVGFYGLSVKIFEWAILPPVFLLNSVFPVLAKSYLGNFAQFKNLARTTALILFITSLVVFLLLFLAPNLFVNLIGGQIFSPSAKAVKILSTGIPIYYLTNLSMWLLVIFEKRRALVGIYAIGLVFNIILNLIFIPRFDFLAAAAITVISEGLILVLSLVKILPSLQKLR